MILNKVGKTIRDYKMLKMGDRVIVAVSGGPDSVCLLYFLKEFEKEYNLNLQVIHFNHNLRKKESEKEEVFVMELAFKLNLPVTTIQLDVTGYAKKHGMGIEEAARNLRYSEFEKLAIRYKTDKVALGHSASDQVETVLMRILRGSGMEGLTGIPPVRKLTGKTLVIRPIIDITREEIIQFLNDNRISYCIDSSNKKTIFFRNKVRLKLLPYIKKNFAGNISDRLLGLSNIIREENEYINELAQKADRATVIHRDKNIYVDFKRLLSYNNFLQRRVIHGIFNGRLSLKNVDAVIRLARDGQAGDKLSLPGCVVRKDYRKLIVLSGSQKAKKKISSRRMVKFPGRTIIEELSLKVNTRITGDKPDFGRDKYTVYFDADKVNLEKLAVRLRKAGDRFSPFGIRGTKKIKDYFIDEKVPVYLREDTPLLVDGNRILWIIGMRQSEEGRVTRDTRKILEISVKRKEDNNDEE